MNNADSGVGDYVTINGLATGTFNGSAFLASSTQVGLVWAAGYDINSASVVHALRAQPLCTSGTCNSPDIELQSMTGGVVNFAELKTDTTGNFTTNTGINVGGTGLFTGKLPTSKMPLLAISSMG